MTARRTISAFRILLITNLLLSAACSASQERRYTSAGVDQTDAFIKVRNGLEALAMDRGEWRNFTVIYDDLNPFVQGGVKLSIFGTGDGEQTVRVPGYPPQATGPTRIVSLSDLKQLVNLLLAHKAWEHRVPEIPEPVATDGYEIHLTIRYGNDMTMIWEMYDDMPNQRLVQIGDFMKKVALRQ